MPVSCQDRYSLMKVKHATQGIIPGMLAGDVTLKYHNI